MTWYPKFKLYIMYSVTMLVRLLVEVDMFSVFPIMDWQRKTIFFDSKCHNSYLIKCLQNNITQKIQYGDTCTYYI